MGGFVTHITAGWSSGEAGVCKTLYSGSNPLPVSKKACWGNS